MKAAVVGIDVGGTNDNVTVIDGDGEYLIDELAETPSQVREGPDVAIRAMAAAFEGAVARVGLGVGDIGAVGLGTPGPASATGVLSSKGGTNFPDPAWHGFDIRGALEDRLGLPVVYSNDANAAALYAHYGYFGEAAGSLSSAAAIVGTGLGGALVIGGNVVSGHAGMAGELGHVRLPLDDILADGQPLPQCNCGRQADAESVASLSGIERNLLPYWLTRFPDHQLATEPLHEGAKALRGLAEARDPLALAVFDQQASVIGRLFSLLADVVDADAYFVGGGVVEAGPGFQDWFLGRVAQAIDVRIEQSRTVARVPDGDMAGARGAALAARLSLLS